MACPFDVRALFGRTFGSVLDEIAPSWWHIGGYDERGAYGLEIIDPLSDPPLPAAERQALDEIKRRLDLVRAALRDGTVILVDIDGRAVPRQAWFAGGWKFDRSEDRGTEWLEVPAEAGRMVKYYSPRFIAPAAPIQPTAPIQPAAAKNKRAYGEIAKALRAAMVEHKEQLSAMKTQAARAAFLANKVDCSPSRADPDPSR